MRLVPEHQAPRWQAQRAVLELAQRVIELRRQRTSRPCELISCRRSQTRWRYAVRPDGCMGLPGWREDFERAFETVVRRSLRNSAPARSGIVYLMAIPNGVLLVRREGHRRSSGNRSRPPSNSASRSPSIWLAAAHGITPCPSTSVQTATLASDLLEELHDAPDSEGAITMPRQPAAGRHPCGA